MRKKMRIPLQEPTLTEAESAAVVQSIRESNLESSGPATAWAISRLRNALEVRHVFLTHSGTGAMELAHMVLGLASSDEVILPSFTFSSTVTAIMRQGARPRFCDINESTFNVTAASIRPHINSRTKGIVVVHYGGRGCEMQDILKLARAHHLWVVEDAAHALGSVYQKRPLGTWGDFGCFSFHQTKNITCGEGGALVFQNPRWLKRTESCFEKGTNRLAFLRKEVPYYEWTSEGGSFGLSDILAGILKPQLMKLSWITRRHQDIAAYYLKSLSQQQGNYILPPKDPLHESNWHIFPVRVPASVRPRLLDFLRKRGVMASTHYQPLHQSHFARHALKLRSSLPVTERVSKELVRLPIFANMSDAMVDYVISAFLDFF